MTQSTIPEIRKKLSESREQTLSRIKSVDEAGATYRIRPDAWSIKDHIAHLAAVEDSVVHFAHRILNEECPVSPLCNDKAFSQEAWNQRTVSERAASSWFDLCQTLMDTRQSLFEILERITDESLNRIGSHPVWGEPVTLESVLRVPYRHERAHRDEIAALSDMQARLLD